MPIRMTGIASGIDPKLVEQLIEAEKIPLETAKKRKEKVVEEKTEFEKLDKAVGELDQMLSSLKTRQDFYKMKVESSHPDILDGICKTDALVGTYEFEVRGMARADKKLAYGFPDKDQTQVGFGYMQVEREDMEPAEIVIEPGSTLQDVANQINQAELGVKALVVNTKYKPDSYRLLVVSEKSGEESRVTLDEDTSFLEFKDQVVGQNLDVLFEDVPVTDDDNILDELIDGVTLNAKRSEPGTRVQISIVHDVDKTFESIKGFVEKYNAIAKFVHDQSLYNKDTKKGGMLSGDGSVKTVMRNLQQGLQDTVNQESKFRTLADIGVITNPKSGELQMDETKVRQALAEDYDAVAKLFIRSKGNLGLADRLASKVKGFRDSQSGVLKSKLRGLDNIIKNQDTDIERRERLMGQKEETIRRRFSALESQMSGIQSQGSILQARFGGGGGGGAGPAPQGGGGG